MLRSLSFILASTVSILSASVAVPAQDPSPVLVGAGDIASCNFDKAQATAKLLDRIAGTVFTAGDNAYPNGTAQEFIECYGLSWGRHRQRTRPSPGNHDYHSKQAAPYFKYFGANAGPAGHGFTKSARSNSTVRCATRGLTACSSSRSMRPVMTGNSFPSPARRFATAVALSVIAAPAGQNDGVSVLSLKSAE